MSLRKYLTLTRAGIIEALQFRLSAVVMVIGNLLYLIVVYFLWKAIYASAGTDIVNGMTFADTLIYLVLATALYGFMEMYAVWEIGRAIQSGKIVLDLLKPIEYRSYLFWSYSGSFVVNFFSTFLPTFIAVCLVTHGAVPLGFKHHRAYPPNADTSNVVLTSDCRNVNKKLAVVNRFHTVILKAVVIHLSMIAPVVSVVEGRRYKR